VKYKFKNVATDLPFLQQSADDGATDTGASLYLRMGQRGRFELWQYANWARSLKQWNIVPNSWNVFFKSVNNSQSCHESLAQLCHQELVKQLQHF